MTPTSGRGSPIDQAEPPPGEDPAAAARAEPPSGEDLPAAVHDTFDRGMRAYVAGQAAEAATAFAEALALAEGFHEARYMLAVVRLRLGEGDAAIALLETVGDLPGDSPVADEALRRLGLLGVRRAASGG